MIRSLWIAKTGMEGQQTKLDAIANNLANVGTNGFKRANVVFEDLMYQNLRAAGSASSDQSQLPTGLQVGLGVRAAASSRNFGQGSLQQTGGNLDIAIKGQGFFQIQMSDGSTGYSRDGAFQLDAAGQMVTSDGHVLQPGITIPANAQNVSIAANGTVSVTVPGQTSPQQVGQLQLASFVNPSGLDPRGQNLYAETAASGAPNAGAPGAEGLGSLLQGYVEGSELEAPVQRVAAADVPTPYAANLEKQALPDAERIVEAVLKITL